MGTERGINRSKEKTTGIRKRHNSTEIAEQTDRNKDKKTGTC